jgi:NADPH2:quinone reductase
LKALLCTELSGDLSQLSLQDIIIDAPGPNEVRLKVLAAAVNFPDVLMVQGLYQMKPALPFIPGGEGVGEVIALGSEVASLSLGERVIFGSGIGAMAEEINVAIERVRSAPKNLPSVQAAAYTAAYHTANVALKYRGDLRPGETLLVHGAAGGVGLAAVQIGKLMGAEVIATASTGEKRRATLAAGADHALSPEPGFYETVRELTAGRGADVIYDPVGGDVFDESTRCIAFGGRLLVVGFTSGRIPTIAVNMPLIKGFSVVGVRAGEFRRRLPELGAQSLAEVDAWVENGDLVPHVGAVLPLAQAAEAMRILKDREAIGKIVIKMSE